MEDTPRRRARDLGLVDGAAVGFCDQLIEQIAVPAAVELAEQPGLGDPVAGRKGHRFSAPVALWEVHRFSRRYSSLTAVITSSGTVR